MAAGGGPAVTTILITGARAPVALHWARLLHTAGHRVILADSQTFPMSRATRFKSSYRRLPPPRGAVAAYAQAVADLVQLETCDLVLPTCEEIFFLAAARDLHGAKIPLCAPGFAQLSAAHNKFRFAHLAKSLGMAPDETVLIETTEIPANLRKAAGDFVFKPVWSRFGNRAVVCPGPDELGKIKPSARDPWIAQSFLPGEELCSWALVREGRVLALQAYRPLYRAGQGAALAFEAVDHPAIPRFVRDFAALTGWTGQLSFDFRHDRHGELKVIECNPRATSGLHFFRAQDGLCEALLEGREIRPTGAGRLTLPLAMIAYGLPNALRNRSVPAWWRDLRDMGDLSHWPGDRSVLPGQIASLVEIALTSVRHRKSLIAAATEDIEWNGESLAPDPRDPSTG